MTSAAKASANFTPADRDFAYKATKDTGLNGTWVLDGLLAANGSWSSTSTWNQDTTAMATNTTMSTDSASTMTAGNGAITNASGGTATTGKRKTKNNRSALYDSAKSRLANTDYKTTSTFDTTAQPFQYWKQIPSLTLNPTRLVFTGSTGCNSMSGSFKFSNKDIQFGRNIVTSKMSCNEYDESNFLSALKKADNYTVNGNMLEIRQGNTLLLTFKKSS